MSSIELADVIFISAFLSISVGAFCSACIVSGIRNGLIRWIVGAVIALVIGFSLTGICVLENKVDEQRYNCGICAECQEKWDLFDIGRRRNGTNIYYYRCKNGHIIEVHTNYARGE